MQKTTIINFVLPALGLLGGFLIVVGVFVFANVLSNRSFTFGALRLPNDPALAVGLIAIGFMLFGATTFLGKVLKGKK